MKIENRTVSFCKNNYKFNSIQMTVSHLETLEAHFQFTEPIFNLFAYSQIDLNVFMLTKCPGNNNRQQRPKQV